MRMINTCTWITIKMMIRQLSSYILTINNIFYTFEVYDRKAYMYAYELR